MALFGLLGNNDAPSMQAAQYISPAQQQANTNVNLLGSANMNNVLNQYAQGGSLSDALKGVQQYSGAGGTEAGLGELSTGPVTGAMTATDMAMQSPMMSGLIGQGGLLNQTEGQISNLQNQGYQLQPNDYEALGQASGNIARQTSMNENSLASALQSRGMGQGASGAANQAYTNLYGNKNEQLGAMQDQIAQQRMQTNMQRLGQMQNFASSLGQIGNQTQNNMFNQNLEGKNSMDSMLQGNRAADTSAYSAQATAAKDAAASQQAAQRPNLGTAIGAGIMGGVGGGLSSGIGSGLGGMMGGGGSSGGGSGGDSSGGGSGGSAMSSVASLAPLAMMAFSDARLKQDVALFDPEEFLNSLNSYQYSYINPTHGQGLRVGVMAQDLEKTPAGKSIVTNTPEGKMVDYAKAVPLMLATIVSLNKRINELEKGR